jgi:hypothetical protein
LAAGGNRTVWVVTVVQEIISAEVTAGKHLTMGSKGRSASLRAPEPKRYAQRKVSRIENYD